MLHRHWMLWALVGTCASAPAMADSYRLAYSKAENIEIFIDHAAGAPWCSPALSLRAVYGSTPDQNALGQLLPKVGVLLAKQCPQATQLEWHSVTASNQAVAHGTSTKASGWTLQAQADTLPAQQTPAPAAAAAVVAPAAAPTSTPDAASAVAPTAAPDATPQQQAAAVTPAPAASTPAASTPAVPTPPPPDAPAAPAATANNTSASADPAPTSPAPTDPTPAPAAPESLAAAPTPEPAAAPEAAPPAPAPEAPFDINGWTPPTAAEALAASKLKTMEDQNGCKIVSSFDLGEQAQYVVLKSEGLSCGPDGYATGKGRLRLERSDGARLASTNDIWLASGFPFTEPVQAARLAHVDKRDNAWFLLGSDAGTRSHYLLRMEPRTFGSGLGVWSSPHLDVVTDRPDAFRKADAIRTNVDAALQMLQTRALPDATSIYITFADNFPQGAATRDSDHLLYEISAQRPYNWRTRQPSGEWRYNLANARNYLFERDERVARQKRNELRQQAMVEQQHLRQYQTLVEEAKQNPQAMLARLQENVRYSPLSGGTYRFMARGRSVSVRMVVHVDDTQDGNAVVDWPYDLRLANQSLKEGWYLARGEATVDPKRLDDDGLPLTSIELKQAPFACQKDGCADLNDPLTGTRFLLGLPDWSPEQAQAIIDQADKL